MIRGNLCKLLLDATCHNVGVVVFRHIIFKANLSLL
jgi:hypothetical protein